MNRLLCLPLVLLLSGCSTARDDAIVSLFEFTYSNAPWPLCLSIYGSDPSKELLSRIVEKQPNVVPASSCQPREASEGGGWSLGDAKHVEMIRINDYHWKSPKKITFDIVHDSNFMFGSSGFTVIVEKLSGYWVPTGTDSDGEWIS